MRREIPYLSVLAAAAPLAVSAPPQHVTEIRVGGGSGSFAVVSRGCEGNVITKNRVDYDNAALEVSHKFPAPVRVGARAGILQLDGGGDPTRYVNPFLSFDWPLASIGAGYVHGDREFPDDDGDLADVKASGHVRFGKPSFYFTASYFEGVPIATGGYAAAGFGKEWPKVHAWLGIGGLPHDKAGLITNVDYKFGGRFALGATGRLGSSEGVSENAFSVGISYQWAHGSGSPTPSSPSTAPGGSTSVPPDSAR